MDLIDKLDILINDSAGNPKPGEKWKWNDGREFTIINVGSGIGPGGKYIDVKFKGDKQTRGIKMTDFFAAGKGATILK
jgi:hypothetical protein